MSEITKPGIKLSSAVCATQIMVLRAPKEAIEISCGGAVMMQTNEIGDGELDPEHAGGTLAGKRYVDTEETMEFLCTRAGEGSLVVNGKALIVKQPKALPSSD